MKRWPTSFSPTLAFTRSKKYCLKILGSRVLPDLLETMQRVLRRSSFFSRALICAGSVESRTCISGKPAILPKVRRRTSGQRLEPPMPRSTTWWNFAFLISAERFFRAEMLLSCSWVMESQLSQVASSAPVHRLASFCQRRATLLLASQSARAARLWQKRSEEHTSELQSHV